MTKDIYYTQGYNYFFGTNGCSRDWDAAAELFRKGYEQGDMNAAYALHLCYSDGTGVPKSSAEEMAIANKMLEAGCPLGYAIMADLYKDGLGVPLNKVLAEEYRNKMRAAAAHPIAGVRDEVRFGAMAVLEVTAERADEALRWAEEYYRVTQKNDRYGFVASILLQKALQDKEHPNMQLLQKSRQLLQDGIAANDALSCLFSGILYSSEIPGHPQDAAKGAELLRKATDLMPLPFSMMANIVSGTGVGEDFVNIMIERAHLGASLKSTPQDLNCRIAVMPNPMAAAYNVYDANVAADLCEREKTDEIIVTPLSPCIIIGNRNPYAVMGAQIRVCVPDMDFDKTFPCPETIAAGGEISINMDDCGIPLQEVMIIEISCSGRSSRINFGDFGLWGAATFAGIGYNPPPLLMFWKKGFFGGYVLNLISFGETLTNVQVHKLTEAHLDNPVTVTADTPTTVGWAEFSDSAGLQENEVFVVECEGYSPVVGKILTTQGDKSTAGWTNVAKAGAGLLISVLGAS